MALTARAGGVDLLPDPLGWLLVVLGLRHLPGGDDRPAAPRPAALGAQPAAGGGAGLARLDAGRPGLAHRHPAARCLRCAAAVPAAGP